MRPLTHRHQRRMKAATCRTAITRRWRGCTARWRVPHHGAGFWRQWRAFVGPALLVSVGYMDPGNWGTDLQGGAQFKYGLLWVVGLASLMAIFMQVISARLGVVTGKDLRNAAATGTRAGPAGRTGSCARSPLALVIWPRCLAARWRSIFCFMFRYCGRVVITGWTYCCCSGCNGLGCARLKQSS